MIREHKLYFPLTRGTHAARQLFENQALCNTRSYLDLSNAVFVRWSFTVSVESGHGLKLISNFWVTVLLGFNPSSATELLCNLGQVI